MDRLVFRALVVLAAGLAAARADASNVTVKGSSEIAAYQDSVATSVLTPSIGASVESPTEGWQASGRYLVDVVSAASPDIVATASPRWTEVRNAGSVAGRYKPRSFGVGASAATSYTPDYLSLDGGVQLIEDLDEKNLTLTQGYGYGRDTIGRTGTPFSVFSRALDYHTLSAGLSRVVNAGLDGRDALEPGRELLRARTRVVARLPAHRDDLGRGRRGPHADTDRPRRRMRELPSRHRRRAAHARRLREVRVSGSVRLATGLVLLGLASCSAPDPSATVAPGAPDRASFGPVARVLVARCGSLDCHGSRYRNLRLYGYGGGRLDATSLPDSPRDVTPAEIDADYDAVVGLEPEVLHQVVAEHGRGSSRLTLVRKARGEEEHKGGQRITPGDAADRCVLSWLAGAVDTDACASAAAPP